MNLSQINFLKHFYKSSIYVLVLIATTLSHAQIADFPFNTNLNDVVTGFSPTAFGNPTLINDGGNQVVQLDGDDYLSMPVALHQTIDPNQDVELQIRFKVTNTYADSPFSGTGEFGQDGKRILISNKPNFISEKGFDIFVIEMDDEYRLAMSFGDEQGGEGIFIFNDLIQENVWTELKVIMRLNTNRPSIVYKLNGYYHHFPFNTYYVDLANFKTSLNSQELWVGTDLDNVQGFEEYAYAEVSIDYIKIYNPISVGNAAAVATALTAMTNHINGTAILSSSQQQTQLTTIVDNWDDNTYAAITADILSYLSIYEQEEGTVYEFYAEYIDPKEVSAPRALQFMLMQYMIDNLYTNSNVSSMAGISFLDHELMPGIVETTAPRISGTATIDGTYNTSPGFYLNNPEEVIRPTGYYAAPGEIVDVSLPSAILNQGVKIHVGAHYIDIREDHRGFQRFPMMATKFEVTNTSISVANPFGGAIYLVFPDGSNFGSVNVSFANAVKSPYYSTKTGFTNSLTQYQTDLSNGYVNWVDIESDNFMCTFPKALAEISPDADAILTPLNAMVGQFNVITGRPSTKIRSEYIISEPQSYTQGTYPAAYPMSIPNGDLNEADVFALPVSAIDPQIYMSTYDGTTMLHELGHLHSIPTMFEEGETNVDIINVTAFNMVFGVPLDTALYYSSGFQFLDGDQAALDWILDPRFRKGEPAEYLEVSYQLRGVAKYTDVARLFSWDTLGLIHQHWYDLFLNGPEPADGIEYVSPDEYIEVASDQLGFNFAPLWHLWGSIPSPSLINQLDNYDKENRIKERILHYRSLVPNNAAEFQAIHSIITPNIEEHHRVRYDDMLLTYDNTTADSIFFQLDEILCTYFDTNCELTDVDVLLEQEAITLLPNPTDGIFEITGLMSGYTIKIIDTNGMVIRTINCSGNSHFIDISELPVGLHFVEITNNQNAQVCLKKIIKQ